MATKGHIGFRLTVEGEKEYKRALKNINSSQKVLTSEMQKLTAEFGKNSESLEYAVAKSNNYKKQIELQNTKIEDTSTLLASAKEKYKECGESVKNLEKKLQDANSQLLEMQKKAIGSSKRIQDQEKVCKELSEELEEAKDTYSKTGIEVDGWSIKLNKASAELSLLQKSSKEAEREVKRLSNVDLLKLNKSLEQIRETSAKIGESLSKVGDTMSKYVTAPLVAGVGLISKGTEEFRNDLAKLENNARITGQGIEVVNAALRDLNAITGETDSNVEALSNLLQAGFKDNNLKNAIEDLSGAVLKFPDTLKIESLSDNLQETLATGKATGQFAELLERLGYNLDTVNKGLQRAIKGHSEQEYILKLLARSGLADVNTAFRANNKALIESSNASYDVKKALADLGNSILPIVSKITRGAADLLDSFNELDGESKKIVGAVLLVTAGIGPVLSGIGKVSAGISALSGIVSAVVTATTAHTAATTVNTAATTAQAAATGTAAAAQTSLNAAMKANPYVRAFGAILSLATAIVALIAVQKKQVENSLGIVQSVKSEKKAWDELLESKNRAIQTGTKEIDNTHILWLELQSLVDETGRVIEHKERVKFIVNEINKVMPESIKLVNGERIEYEKGKNAIEEYIEKKRLQLELEAMEPAYKQALTDYESKLNDQTKISIELASEKIKLQEGMSFQLGRTFGDMVKHKQKILDLESALSVVDNQLASYTETMSEYEDKMKLYTTGSAKAISEYNQTTRENLKSCTEATTNELAEQAKQYAYRYAQIKNEYEQGNKDITVNMLQTAENLSKRAWNEYSKVGQQTVNGYLQGFESEKVKSYNSLQEWASNLVSIAKRELNIKSPSRRMAKEVGVPTAQGFKVGFESELNSTFSGIQKAVNAKMNQLAVNIKSPVFMNTYSLSQPAPTYITENYYATIDAKSIKEIEDLKRVFSGYRQSRRKG